MCTKNLIIRNAELKDVKNITVLKQQVWISTYAVEGVRTEFSDYVLSEFTVENTQKTIKNKNTYTIIAENNNYLIGCIEINIAPECPPPLTKQYPEITILYVLEKFCGLGIGKKLLKEAINLVNHLNYSGTWLTAYHKNERAIRFYEKNQFEIIGTTYFKMKGNKYENKIMFYKNQDK